MSFTTHAEHFLSRIDRLGAQHAELALGLYRDHELVRYILGHQALSDHVERVAISLADGDRGPYVIVTREGRFVTCLGEGMRVGDDLPLIRRGTLDHLGGQIDALRALIQHSAGGNRRHCDQLLERVLKAGNTVTQEQFDDLVTWSPCVGSLYADALVRALVLLETGYERLKGVKRVGKRSEPLLKAYWQTLWSVLHLLSLVGDRPEVMQRTFEKLDDTEASSERYRLWFLLLLWKTGLQTWALRGAWFAARMPKAFLRPLKAGFDTTALGEGVSGYGWGLAAIGHRHQRYQAEISKFLMRAKPPDDAPPLEHYRAYVGRVLAQEFATDVRQGLMDVPRQEADAFMDHLSECLADTDEERAVIAAIPAETRLAMLFTLPTPTTQRPEDLSRSFLFVPAVARMNARDFYVPERYQELVVPRQYSRTLALAYVQPRRAEDELRKPPPSRAPVRPSRNAPCPCNSGRKYKRCCGAGMQALE